MRSLTFPSTWTTSVTDSSRASSGSKAGHGSRCTLPFPPSSSRHSSSATNGPIGASISTSKRADSPAPPPASSVRRIPFVSSMSFEMAVLNLYRSRSSVTAFTVRWARPRMSSGSSAFDPAASITALHTRPNQL